MKAALLTFTYTRILQTALVFTVSRGTHADLSKKAVEKKAVLPCRTSCPFLQAGRHGCISAHDDTQPSSEQVS